jgi:hypothetical protein
MIAVDTNILIHAHRQDAEFHEPAAAVLRELAEGTSAWSIPWPCLHELIAITTHPRIFDPPSRLAQALDQVEAWRESPTLVLLSEEDGFFDVLRRLLSKSRVTGPRVHDARIAAICLQHGVRELWTADRDFGRFPDLATRNPLIG